MTNRAEMRRVAIDILRENDRRSYTVPTKQKPCAVWRRNSTPFYAAVYERMQTGGGHRLILPDHVHPNSAGHCVIAESLAEATTFD